MIKCARWFTAAICCYVFTIASGTLPWDNVIHFLFQMDFVWSFAIYALEKKSPSSRRLIFATAYEAATFLLQFDLQNSMD